MKRLSVMLMTLLLTAAPALAGGIDETIDKAFKPLADALADFIFFKVHLFGADWSLVVVWLFAGAVFFTLYLGFISIKGFTHSVKITRGDFANPDNPGEVSHFQALCTAVSGTVGIGNIGGIPIAITMGGPGAVFWMILAGFLGMSTKFVECTLSTKYRRQNADGSVSGGPMYYIQKGFEKKNLPGIGKAVGLLYAVGIVAGCMGIGNMFQSNQAFMQFVVITGGKSSFFADKGWLFGIVFAAIVFMVICGGIKSISKVAEKIVPFMAVFYLSGALIIIALNWNYIVPAVALIVKAAFKPDAMYGGMIGVMLLGFQRAIFSNEAGLGSAAIAHSAVKTKEPITEGFVALLEPFVDTIVIQTITALVIVTTMLAVPEFMDSGLRGMEMTSAAFQRHIGFAPYAIAFAGLLFAFSTAIAWSYYGLKGWTYIAGEGKGAAFGFNVVFCLFFALGCMIDLDSVMKMSDALVFVICVPNILGLYMLAPDVKEELERYLGKVRSGKIVDYKKAAAGKGNCNSSLDRAA